MRGPEAADGKRQPSGLQPILYICMAAPLTGVLGELSVKLSVASRSLRSVDRALWSARGRIEPLTSCAPQDMGLGVLTGQWGVTVRRWVR